MTQNAFRGVMGLAAVLCIGLLASPIYAEEVSIGDAEVTGLETGTVDVNLQNDTEVEGFVLAIGYDTTKMSVTDVYVTGTATDTAGAELVVAEIFDSEGGFTLGVVLDSTAPFDGQTIPASVVDQVIAKFDFVADIVVPDGTEEEVDLTFEDGTFNTPILNNILVQGGASISIVDDITNNAGTATLLGVPPDTLFLGDADADPVADDTRACVEVTLDNADPIQGFVLSVAHPETELTLDQIVVDGVADAAGAEFVVDNIYADGGTLGVVLDFDSPFNGQTISVGASNHIASFYYTCDNPPGGFDPATTHEVSFVDGTFGAPALDNVVVAGGLSRNPDISDTGTVTCVPPPPVDTRFYCGVLDDDGNIVDAEGSPGDTIEMCVFYSDPTDNLQGVQIAMCADEKLCFVDGSFSVEDTIFDAVGTEYLNQSQDCDPDDGDGIEMTVGILLDALPPFEDQTVPQTEHSMPLAIGCFEITIADDAPCDTCCPVEFCNDVNGAEALPIQNLAVIDFEGKKGFATFDCNVCIVQPMEFVRGDCNGDMGMVNIADAAAMLGLQFQGLSVPCDDACDANDDGKVNLADTVFLLNYLFKSGDEPPAPGADMDPGIDETDDELGCDEGQTSCV